MQQCLDKLPKLDRCCGCITDLKVAAAIIAVLGIVTSPLVSWVVVRHMYVIRVSCVVSTTSARPDVVDIQMSNALSFGFGMTSGLGFSCLSKNVTGTEGETKMASNFIKFVRFSGWVVLVADGFFVFSSINYLANMSRAIDMRPAFVFVIAGFISILLSFIYGLLYVSACVYLGGLFPVFEFFFACFDLIIWVTWLYFIVVMNAFSQHHLQRTVPTRGIFSYYFSWCPFFKAQPSSVWTYYLMVVYSFRPTAAT